LRTRFATCSKRLSAAVVADFSCAAAPPPLLELLERALVERAPPERAPPERVPLERVPLERELLARVPLERELLLRELEERLEPDEPPDERRDPELPEDEPDLEPPLLACGTSPPLRGQRCTEDTTRHRAFVVRSGARALERQMLEC
jgi:hypothetical protein